ncbi:P-loop containing nucleoside triphosphate hydrolase protein [Cyathus striatus]|nr:P-loop containing nucleoside triphosphate hydrolase protein [Cyathus striatus]
MRDKYVSEHHILLALENVEIFKDSLQKARIDPELIHKYIFNSKRNLRILSMGAGDKLETLHKFAVDLTAMAAAEKIDTVIGRDSEILRVIRILCRKTKNSAVLLGEAGVGKTAIAEGLAQRIVRKDIPANLDAKVFSLDMGALIAGASSRGEYEERIKGVIDERRSGERVILFIDELHLILAGRNNSSSNSGMDAANLLKPALARGQLRCIGATTLAEYREHIEKDAALERRFAQVLVNEPSMSDAITILRGIKQGYESHHNVIIYDSALVTSVELASRYITHRRLPDSAIDIIDEASASARVISETMPEDLDKYVRDRERIRLDIRSLEDEKRTLQIPDPGLEEKLEAARKELAESDSRISRLEGQYGIETALYDKVRYLREQIVEERKKMTSNEIRFDDQLYTQTQQKIKDYELELASHQAQNRPINPSDKPVITKESVAKIVERMTRIPLQQLLESDKENLLNLEGRLKQKVIGQAQAVKAVASAIQRARNGLVDETRPIASYLFTGSSGTGKTYLSKVLAECLFSSQDALVRIDASEYNTGHSISRLIGAPPGYVGYDQGGQLTEYIRRNPFSLILIDEIEKACREFITLFLQVLDDGRLTDGHGRVIDFRNTVIIMTSNLGAPKYGSSIVDEEEVKNEVFDYFPVEFTNRIDEIIIFQPLTVGDIELILDIHIKELRIMVHKKKMRLNFERAAQQKLAAMACEQNLGARPLMRELTQKVTNPISLLILQNKVKEWDTIRVFEKNGEIEVSYESESEPMNPGHSFTDTNIPRGPTNNFRIPEKLLRSVPNIFSGGATQRRNR